MARDFDGIDDILESTSIPVSTYPFTMACWVNTVNPGNRQFFMGITTDGTNDHRHFLSHRATGFAFLATSRDASTTAEAITTTGASDNIWSHACGVFTSATSRACFINGGSKGTDATSVTPSGMNRTRFAIAPGGSDTLDGLIAEAAVWNVALSDAEVLMLGQGAHPYTIRPGALVGYWPLYGISSPEPDMMDGGIPLTVTGALRGDHPIKISFPWRITIAEGVSAAQVFLQSLAGTLTSSGALTKSVGKSLAGTLTSVGALTNSVGKSLAGTLTSVGALTNSVGKSLTGSLTSLGALTNSVGKSLTGSLTSLGALTNSVGKGTAGVLNEVGQLTNQAQMSLTAALTSSGALTKSVLKQLAGTLLFSGDLTKRIDFALAATLTTAGALTKQVGKGLAALFDLAGNLTREAGMSLAGTLISAGTSTKQVGKQLAGTATFSGALTAVRVVLVMLAGTLAFSGDLTKSVLKQLFGTLASSGDLTKSVLKQLSGTLASSGDLTKLISHALSATLTSSGALTKRISHALAATLTLSGNLSTILLLGAVARVFFRPIFTLIHHFRPVFSKTDKRKGVTFK